MSHAINATPALRQARWSGKKTAVVAALAIGLSSAGAVGAAAAVPAGTNLGGNADTRGPGGMGGFGGQHQWRGGNFNPGAGFGAQPPAAP